MTSTEDNKIANTSLPKVDLLDYLLFPIFVTCFFGTLIIFEFIQRIAILISKEAHLNSVLYLNKSLNACLKILNIKIEVINSYQADFEKPLIVISNHQSFFDIPILHVIFAEKFPRFIAKKELGKWIPSVSFNLRKGENCLIDRGNARQAIPAIKKFAKLLNERKFAAIIFPEGTRARDGKLKQFHAAGATALIDNADTPIIIPVTIENSWKLATRKFGPIPRNIVIRATILPKLETNQLTSRAIIELAYQKIAENLEKR
ncbi:MAG: 1-acyl-sn-glycerol-3-phosphate acyltransferase [Proteobacteria bacterium]|nr:1-acyl-sn-glycerol-3-phosphate acyltransferase [Pseudomonadota bacterium]